MNTQFSLASVSPVRMTVASLCAAAVWLFAPELAQAAVTFGDIGHNVADSAKGVAKGITVTGFAAGAAAVFRSRAVLESAGLRRRARGRRRRSARRGRAPSAGRSSAA